MIRRNLNSSIQMVLWFALVSRNVKTISMSNTEKFGRNTILSTELGIKARVVFVPNEYEESVFTQNSHLYFSHDTNLVNGTKILCVVLIPLWMTKSKPKSVWQCSYNWSEWTKKILIKKVVNCETDSSNSRKKKKHFSEQSCLLNPQFYVSYSEGITDYWFEWDWYFYIANASPENPFQNSVKFVVYGFNTV